MEALFWQILEILIYTTMTFAAVLTADSLSRVADPDGKPARGIDGATPAPVPVVVPRSGSPRY